MYYLWFTFSTTVNFVSDICDFCYHFEVAKDDLPNESMKTDKVMEFDSNKEISDNVGIDSEVQKSGRQKRKPGWLVDYETY
jgi:hypothetical protein